MLTYQLTVKGLDSLQRSFQQAPRLTMAKTTVAMNKSLVRLQATAKELSPVDNGTLRASILIAPPTITGNVIRGAVGTSLEYGEWQERGTGIYGPYNTPIRPKNKKMLAWNKNGKWHFAKEVKGSRPRWYMRGSIERNREAINGYFDAAADEVLKAMVGGTQ